MFDERSFTDRYDLYRPSVTTSASGAQTVAQPETPTGSDLLCCYFPTPGVWRATEAGPDLDYDARLVMPASQDLRPAARGQQPDCIEIDGRRFVVLVAWDAAGRGLFKIVLLRQLRA